MPISPSVMIAAEIIWYRRRFGIIAKLIKTNRTVVVSCRGRKLAGRVTLIITMLAAAPDGPEKQCAVICRSVFDLGQVE